MDMGLILIIASLFMFAEQHDTNIIKVVSTISEPIYKEQKKEERERIREENPGIENHEPSMRVIHDPYGKVIGYGIEECTQLENECSRIHGEEKFSRDGNHKIHFICECKW
tara:strand:- start:404 stop:736 length:333 start_codon:yes stop_codon:yes gene_type:complete